MGSGGHKDHEAITLTPPTAQNLTDRYQTAAAFRQALTDLIKAAAAKSPFSHDALRRQFAYDRLLTRLFVNHPDRWVLKGGAGLLTRLADAARHSQDLDLFYQGQQEAAVDEIMTAAALELGDWFDFEIGPPKPISGVHKGQRLPVTALLDGKEVSRFTVDAVVAVNITQPPEPTPPLSPVYIPELPTTTYHLYPLVDHIADKHAAMLQQFGGKPSSRYRDLIDLVLIAESQPISAGPLQTALVSEYAHRGLTPPKEVSLPTEEWVAGYAAEVTRAPAATARTAHDALQLMSIFLNPILNGKSSGNWDPTTATWTDDD